MPIIKRKPRPSFPPPVALSANGIAEERVCLAPTGGLSKSKERASLRRWQESGSGALNERIGIRRQRLAATEKCAMPTAAETMPSNAPVTAKSDKEQGLARRKKGDWTGLSWCVGGKARFLGQPAGALKVPRHRLTGVGGWWRRSGEGARRHAVGESVVGRGVRPRNTASKCARARGKAMLSLAKSRWALFISARFPTDRGSCANRVAMARQKVPAELSCAAPNRAKQHRLTRAPRVGGYQASEVLREFFGDVLSRPAG
ncbi:hypothetical protein DFJ73DRAFT_956514 [Zopfochytrium polystomum]|nr:hypothetical protein DFJ73DRAFT_956514 [Zopfochytrium polystomum]